MLRVPQHERKKINDINSFPFVLSAVEGLLRAFQQPPSLLQFTEDRLSSKNFNTLVMLLKQNFGRDVQVTSYLMHACPRCKYFLGVVVRESSGGGIARSVRGVCVRCRYQLSWKLIPGRRSTYLHGSNPPQARTLTLIKSNLAVRRVIEI